MPVKALPFSESEIRDLMKRHSTPFYIYDEQGIRNENRVFREAFGWVRGPDGRGFQNYFAVKACPNAAILRINLEEKSGLDCSSMAELQLAEEISVRGEDIMFTSNDTPSEEFAKARSLGAIINLDDITHLKMLEEFAGIPELLCFRYNPGPLRTGNAIIGKPEEAKYGVTTSQIPDAYRMAKEKGAKRFGLHTMIASNELNPDYFVETGRMLFDLVGRLSDEVGITFEFVDLGGGIGIPYKPEQKPVDLKYVSQGIKDEYEKKIVAKGFPPLRVVMECGRAITGPHGFLVSRVRHVARKYKDYVGLDACMANLMRPGMYGAYHHITVLGKQDAPCDHTYDVTGSLCENNDKFAIDRKLPKIEPGDVLVIHDAGAHGMAMCFQYNGKLRCAEFLRRAPGEYEMIRRAETYEDYVRTQRGYSLPP